MALEDKKILEILLKENYVSQEAIDRAVKEARAYGDSAIAALLAQQVITKDIIGQAIAESYKVPYADLNTYIPSKEQVMKIPEDLAVKYRMVLFSDSEKGTIVATDEPAVKGLADAARRALKKRSVKVAYSLTEDIDQVLLHYREPLADRINEIAEGGERVAPNIVNEIIEDAVLLGASDIHFEPQEERIMIRFRVDGILEQVCTVSHPIYEGMVNRIKVMAHLRTDQHVAAQDGSIRHKTPRESVDIRVSIVPIFDGEKIVMRLLAAYAKSFSLNDLGLSSSHQDQLVEVGSKSFGMMMVTGPTGSGKTTSLYGLLKQLNKPEVNIATIEDPVEYKIDGVNHIQVNAATELTFARGLRSIVRQDPDIILVGEIRDKETAEIAVNAALTGHMLLSTFHANDAATAIPRLLDMGIEPFLLASTLEAVVAQRLLRTIDESRRHTHVYSKAQIAEMLPEAAPYFKDKETLVCACPKGSKEPVEGSGYSGRTGVFEVIQVTPEMRELIMTRPTSQEIWALARSQGARSMFEDAIDKVKAGLTTLEEVKRVVTPPKELTNAPKQKETTQKAKASNGKAKAKK